MTVRVCGACAGRRILRGPPPPGYTWGPSGNPELIDASKQSGTEVLDKPLRKLVDPPRRDAAGEGGVDATEPARDAAKAGQGAGKEASDHGGLSGGLARLFLKGKAS